MKHETCEKCGASLDFGERCDCERNIHNALPAAHSDKPYASLNMPKEVKHGQINWKNRPITAQYATVTDEFGDEHYGKLYDFIENNLVGYCSECGKRLDDTYMNYCPNCGAKMEKETDSAEIAVPAPMPRYIKDMINRYRLERR